MCVRMTNSLSDGDVGRLVMCDVCSANIELSGSCRCANRTHGVCVVNGYDDDDDAGMSPTQVMRKEPSAKFYSSPSILEPPHDRIVGAATTGNDTT